MRYDVKLHFLHSALRIPMFLAGAIGALAMPPVFVWPCIFLSYGYLFYRLVNAESPRRAFWTGWWWGLGYFVAGLYWVCLSLTVDMEQFGWMIPFALFGLNGTFALFPALAGYVGFKLLRTPSVNAKYAGFVLCMCISEWLRGNILTGFPWNLAAYSWMVGDVSANVFATIGLYPLTALTMLLSAIPFAAWQKRQLKAGLIRFVVLFSAMWGLGFISYTAEDSDVVRPDITVRLVQPNIEQRMKWDPDFQQQALATHIELSQLPSTLQPELIIWSESSFPYMIDLAEGVPPELTEWLRPTQRLVMGAVTKEDGRYYNSMVVVNQAAEIEAVYHKQHLVPFGEFVPLRDWLPIDRIVPGSADFSTGEGARLMSLPKAGSFVPLICYEAIFPGYSANEDASWLLNITNDAWFGKSSGPYQHLHMVRARAIEQHKPLVRVANTGVSAVLDEKGNVVAKLPLNHVGVVDVNLLNYDTFYPSFAR